MNMKLELIIIGVSDVERAIAFYRDKLGFSIDFNVTINENLRFVQATPPGSACSIAFGVGISDMPAGSMHGLQVVVDDAQAAYDELTSRGVECTPVVKLDWGTFTYFNDPDGNKWAVQQLPPRNNSSSK
jgi:catechol 2,3-dioxygenase-like lactoylglutathione lyase family enzyme